MGSHSLSFFGVLLIYFFLNATESAHCRKANIIILSYCVDQIRFRDTVDAYIEESMIDLKAGKNTTHFYKLVFLLGDDQFEGGEKNRHIFINWCFDWGTGKDPRRKNM